MKASELIKLLQELKQRHGDLEVATGNPDENLEMDITSVQHLDFMGVEKIQIFSHVGPYCRACGRGCD